jgi:hypothetical protein
MKTMGRLVGPLLTSLGALLFAAPGSVMCGDTAAQQAPTPNDCSSSRVESISCGSYYFDVAGRVVFTSPDGTLVPVRAARFFDAEDPARGVDAEPRDMKVKTTRSGEFRFQAFVSTSSRSKPCPNDQVQTREVYLPSFYLLRARGCEDLTIRVEKDWNPGTIVMNCPGRS